MKYVINQRLGVVHTADCSALRRVAPIYQSDWDPAKAHLAPGVLACPRCLREVPADPPTRPLLRDEEWEALSDLADESHDTTRAEALWPGFTKRGGYVLRLGIEALLQSRGHR